MSNKQKDNMSIKQKVTKKTIVLVARTFNPSILKESWLREHGVIAKEESIQGSIFTDGGIQLVTPSFILTATLHNLQLEFLAEDTEDIIKKTVITIINKLHHISYIALGINFDIDIIEDGGNYKSLSSKLFYTNNNSPIASVLGGDESCYYGGYISKDVLHGRMKLNVTPLANLTHDGIIKNAEMIKFNFNYHHDLLNNETCITEISKILKDWQSYYKDATTNVQEVLKKL